MTIGILRLVLFIEGACSLKEKRMVLHSLTARLRNEFNVSVAQIDDEDKWQRATLAVVGIARHRQQMDRLLSGVVNFISRSAHVDIINQETEMI